MLCEYMCCMCMCFARIQPPNLSMTHFCIRQKNLPCLPSLLSSFTLSSPAHFLPPRPNRSTLPGYCDSLDTGPKALSCRHQNWTSLTYLWLRTHAISWNWIRSWHPGPKSKLPREKVKPGVLPPALRPLSHKRKNVDRRTYAQESILDRRISFGQAQYQRSLYLSL